MTNSYIFGDFPKQYTEYKNAKIVLLPVPYDGTSTWIKGADRGPQALLEASPNLEFYDIETGSEVYKKGIYTAPFIETDNNSSPEDMNNKTLTAVSRYIKDDKFVVTIGGEHSVSYGPIKAHAETYSNMSVLQLDAHTDLRNEYHGSKFNHACIMARAREICPIVQVGIRSLDTSEIEYLDNDNIYYAKDIYDNNRWHHRAISHLTDNVYVTIDLDVFDISIMPATGTPEPGGLSWYCVLHFLKRVSEKKNIIGFDIVELCPNSYSKPQDFMAAKLIYTLLSYIHAD